MICISTYQDLKNRERKKIIRHFLDIWVFILSCIVRCIFFGHSPSPWIRTKCTDGSPGWYGIACLNIDQVLLHRAPNNFGFRGCIQVTAIQMWRRLMIISSGILHTSDTILWFFKSLYAVFPVLELPAPPARTSLTYSQKSK